MIIYIAPFRSLRVKVDKLIIYMILEEKMYL